MTLLNVISISAGYRSGIVVEGVSISVGKGETITLIGPNGSGKSTLIKSIVGLADVYAGQVIYKDQDITGKNLYQITRAGIGYVPQIDNIFSELTVHENLEIGGYLLDRKKKMLNIRRAYALFPDLKSKSDKKAGLLSGGERQMLAVARALMSSPSLVLLDEPTANLSPIATTNLIEGIREINMDGVSAILVEQNVRRAVSIASRVYVLVSGRIVHHAPANQVAKADISKLFFANISK